MKHKILILIILLTSILLSGCISTANRLPDNHEKIGNLKEQHDYEILNLQGQIIFYQDGNEIKKMDISSWGDSSFYIMYSNRTYLHYEKYGGLADYYQWTLYVRKE